jgi:short subunit dehydrogenase-like uncharacterized protein
LISTVGPFIRYGTAVVEACAVNGTHYVDSTGEITWVKEMVDKYHKTAKANGAIVSVMDSQLAEGEVVLFTGN